MGEEYLSLIHILDRIYEYADVLHCEPIEKVAHEFVTECKITTGNFDNVIECRYRIPDYWDIGEVYELSLIHI